MFTWYELRSTDLQAAQSFYAEVLGWRTQHFEGGGIFLQGEHPVGELAVLPAGARARGAPPHWLGYLAVADVDACARRFVAAGGELLGPVRRGAAGDVAVLRDPQGAVIGLSSREGGPSPAVVWHELYTTDPERAFPTYAEILSWRAAGMLELVPELGPYRTFSWNGSERSVGGMVSTVRAPHIHTHWLFYLGVDDLERACKTVTACGGRVLTTRTLPGGDRIAPCEDAERAMFALRQRCQNR
jgi:predicted enzyme related to lactoylglutathione lyase